MSEILIKFKIPNASIPAGFENNEKLSLTKEENFIIATVKAKEGSSLLDAAHNTIGKIILEGSCEGSLACSTCHVILEEAAYKQLLNENEIAEDEEDMLDLAFGLTSTSRLGCQIILKKQHEGFVFTIPALSRNLK